MSSGMITPGQQEFAEQFGEAPEILDEPWIQRIQIDSDNGTLQLSFDAVQRSVEFLWSHGSETVWRFVRESAKSLSIRTEGQETRLFVEFESEGLSGQLDVRVFPTISIRDSMLYS
ncbi:hypothetical protein LZ318_35165 [Saccharopolyspora indica]|uniref:hypothetical protein n=1 Tax=Saccharopolyspora indica TaxID=1229659 RepID=UPI0022EB08A7|nr:hypothetical protein [Saccharopolyspora indica]MDA3649827.1 hypothetical protein [Saccharopolyspora indica]